jgi:hypothetical protein
VSRAFMVAFGYVEMSAGLLSQRGRNILRCCLHAPQARDPHGNRESSWAWADMWVILRVIACGDEPSCWPGLR